MPFVPGGSSSFRVSGRPLSFPPQPNERRPAVVPPLALSSTCREGSSSGFGPSFGPLVFLLFFPVRSARRLFFSCESQRPFCPPLGSVKLSSFPLIGLSARSVLRALPCLVCVVFSQALPTSLVGPEPPESDYFFRGFARCVGSKVGLQLALAGGRWAPKKVPVGAGGCTCFVPGAYGTSLSRVDTCGSLWCVGPPSSAVSTTARHGFSRLSGRGDGVWAFMTVGQND